MTKEFCLSSIEIERYRKERYAWLYLHALPPRKDCEEDAVDFAVMLRALDGCVRAVSTGDDIDLEYEFEDCEFRFAYDGIHGLVVECDESRLDRVKAKLARLCTVEVPR